MVFDTIYSFMCLGASLVKTGQVVSTSSTGIVDVPPSVMCSFIMLVASMSFYSVTSCS
jgi:hypothetical protein